jgi:hypothetical protein
VRKNSSHLSTKQILTTVKINPDPLFREFTAEGKLSVFQEKNPVMCSEMSSGVRGT